VYRVEDTAVKSYFQELTKIGRVVVIVGARDPESERRAMRPPVRIEDNIMYVAPIKFWTQYMSNSIYYIVKSL